VSDALSPTTLRAIAAVCAAIAFVLNGHYDATSIGELALAVIALFSVIQAQVKSHAAKPDETAHAPVVAGHP